MERTLNRKALAEELDKDAGQITRWTKSGMPHNRIGRNPRYNAAECRAWIAEHVHERPDLKKREQAPAMPAAVSPSLPLLESAALAPVIVPTKPPQIVPGLPADHPLMKTLLSNERPNPMAMAEAVLSVATRQVALKAQAGEISAQQLDSVSKALEELRRSQAAWMEISADRGQLIQRDVALAVCGQMAQRLKECVDRIVNSLSQQVEVWTQDPAFSLPTDSTGRNRLVRAWVENFARDIRRLEAEEIDKMIERERKDGESAA